MRLRPRTRELWEVQPGIEIRRAILRVALLLGAVAAFATFAVVWVGIVRPIAFAVIGRVVVALGGGEGAAIAVVVGTYLAALGVGVVAWTAFERGDGRLAAIIACVSWPLWLLAMGITPPSRTGGRAQISAYVGSPTLGAHIQRGVTVGAAIFVVIGWGYYVLRWHRRRVTHHDRWGR